MRSRLPLVLLVLVLAAPLAAQEQQPSLERRLETMATRLEAARIELHVPGMGLAVVAGDRVVARGFGVRDLEKDLPATADTLFAIGSTTKAFTAALVAALIDEGRMGWDDPVARHLPYFRLHDEAASKEVTIRDLLCHRTGLTRMDLVWYGSDLTRDEVVRQIAQAELYAPFRKRFLYNNNCYVAAGQAAAAAGGKTWDELLAERLLAPLGMDRTTTSGAKTQADPDSARGYQWLDESRDWKALPRRDATAVGPAGAIDSSANDMARWLTLLLRKGALGAPGERRILAAERVDEMFSPQIAMAPNLQYGLGWMIGEWEGRRLVFHGGNIDGYSAIVALLPEEGIAFALLVNSNVSPLANRSIGIVFESLLGEVKTQAGAAPAEAKPMAAEALEPYLGRYRFDLMKADLTVLVKDGKLAVDVPGQTVYLLRWPGEDGRWRFEISDDIQVSFAAGEDGRMETMTLHQAGREFAMPRTEKEPEPPIALEEVLALRARTIDEDGLPARFRSTGKVRFVHQGIEGRVTETVDGERYLVEMDLGRFGWIRSGFDGERAWTAGSSSPLEVREGAFREQTLLDHPARLAGDWGSHYAKVEVTGETTIDGRKAWSVRLTPALSPARTVHVDAETGLILGEERANLARGVGAIPLSLRYADHRPFAGVLVPWKTTMENVHQGRVEGTTEAYETEFETPAGFFDPPAGEDGD